MALSWLLITFAVVLAAAARELQYPPEDEPHHERIRRFIYFHSRPNPKADEQRGIGFTGHMANLLKGGTLGVEFHLPRKLDPYLEKWGSKWGLKKAPPPVPDMDVAKKAEAEKEWEEVDREERSNDYGVGQIDPRKKESSKEH